MWNVIQLHQTTVALRGREAQWWNLVDALVLKLWERQMSEVFFFFPPPKFWSVGVEAGPAASHSAALASSAEQQGCNIFTLTEVQVGPSKLPLWLNQSQPLRKSYFNACYSLITFKVASWSFFPPPPSERSTFTIRVTFNQTSCVRSSSDLWNW